jgi:tetratricopeptide (TPR) repeat protein
MPFSIKRFCPVFLLALFFAVNHPASIGWAQGQGGGKAKPSMGRVGGGGTGMSRPSGMARPNSGKGMQSRPNPSMARPSLGNAKPAMQRPASQSPNIQRPNVQRPSTPNLGGNRPSLGGVGGNPSKPMTRPTTPGQIANPGGIGRPAPTTRPGASPLAGGNARPWQTRPNIELPSTKPPINKPPVERPTIQPGGVQRPSIERPNGGQRPNIGAPGARPPIGTTRPSTLPGNITRPSTLPGNITLPSTRPIKPGLGAGKPTPLPGDLSRPIGSNRPETRPMIPSTRPNLLPGDATRPGGVTRPSFNQPGFGNPRPPGFDKWTNTPSTRPIIGGNTNINSNNNQFQFNSYHGGDIHYHNRPNWDFDPGYSRPAWGLNGSNWCDHWHNNCIRPNYNWYNGCWNGYWNSSWYQPVTAVAVGWGLNSWANNWGQLPYYNPYYAQPAAVQAMPYNYSQPVTVNNYVSANDQGAPVQAESTPTQQEALSKFDQGLAQFQQGSYVPALARFKDALKELPGDAVVHEVTCLAQFAVGDYVAAAAGLNSLLASAPGMDWTTMSSLYGNSEDYTKQLRKLEAFAQSNPDDAASHFVLAYHYLVLGSKEEAINALEAVVQKQPRDATAKRMLEALQPSAAAAESLPEPAPNPALTVDSSQQTDLVGVWQAKQGETSVELTIGEDYQFVWKAVSAGQPAAELRGNLAGDAAGIELVTADQGTLAGAVVSQGADAWIFRIADAPASDPGINFVRTRN